MSLFDRNPYGGNIASPTSTTGAAGGGGGISWSDPVDANIVPDTDATYNLGTSSLKFNTIYSATQEMYGTNPYIYMDNNAGGFIQVYAYTPAASILGFENSQAVVETQGGLAIVNYGDATGNGIEIGTTSGAVGSGRIHFSTANSGAQNSGNIEFLIGTSTATQGVFKFLQSGNAPSIGDVWTASAVDGTGYWAAPSGGGGTRREQLVGGGIVTIGGTYYDNRRSIQLNSSGTGRVTYNATYHNQTNNISAFVWVKPNFNTDGFYYSQYDFGNGNQKWAIGHRDAGNVFEVLVHDGTNFKQYQSTANFDDGNWHHVGFTFASNVFRLYVDGAELTGGALNQVTDGTVNTLNASTADIMIGCLLSNNSPSTSATGKFDHFCFFDKQLSGAEVNELYSGGKTTDVSSHSASANLIAWYPVDGSTLPTLTDEVNAQNATMTAQTLLTSDVVYGAGSLELEFDNSFFVEVPGLAYSANEIPSTESPITFSNEDEAAYVTLNDTGPGGTLSVTTAAISSVPSTAYVLARRAAGRIYVGNTTMFLGDSSEI